MQGCTKERLGARLHVREIRSKAAWKRDKVQGCMEERLRGRLHGREIRCKAAWKRD